MDILVTDPSSPHYRPDDPRHRTIYPLRRRVSPPEKRPWDAPFCSETRSAYCRFLHSDRLGYETLQERLAQSTSAAAHVLAGLRLQELEEPAALSPAACDLDRGETWITRSAGHGENPRALIQFLAQLSAEVYDRAEWARSGPFSDKLIRMPVTRRLDRSFSASNAFAYGFVFERTAFLIFCGTDEGIADNLDNLRGRRGSHTFELASENSNRAVILPSVHKGFACHLERIIRPISRWLSDLSSEIEQVMCAGHSLGGALAVLASQLLHGVGHKVPCVVTFGAPAPGGRAFAKGFNLSENTWRIEHAVDPIPRFTSHILGFRHVGNLIAVDPSNSTNAWSSKTDAYLSEGMLGGLHLAVRSFHPRLFVATLAAKKLVPAGLRFARSFSAHKMRDIYLAQTEIWLKDLMGEESELLRSRHAYYLSRI